VFASVFSRSTIRPFRYNHVMNWQYKVVSVEHQNGLDAALNEAGLDGWELVTVTLPQTMKAKDAAFGTHIDDPWYRWDLFFKKPASA